MAPKWKLEFRRNISGLSAKRAILPVLWRTPVKEGLAPDVMPETSARQLADRLLGLRREFGEEIHPRRRIRKRQMATLAALNNSSHAEPPEHPARSSSIGDDRVDPCGSTPPP
jgi:hypothetical protein